MTVILIGGLVTWLVTKIIIESEIFQPVRRFVRRRTYAGEVTRWLVQSMSADAVSIMTGDTPKRTWRHLIWDKVDYLLTCHLCTGVWVGLLVALAYPAAGMGLIITALAYKAVAHLLLAVEKYLDDTPVVNVHETHFDFGGDDDDGDGWDDDPIPPDDPDAWLRHLTASQS